MSTTLISLERLQQYNTAIKGYINAEDAKVKAIADAGIKTVTYDDTTRALKFYTVSEPTGSTAPVYSFTVAADLATRLGQAESDIDALESALGAEYSSTSTIADAIAAAKKAGDDAQADIDALELVVGQKSAAAVGTVGEEGYVPAKAATGIQKEIEDLKSASSTGVDNKITAAIEDLDATVSSSDVETGKGVKVTVTETDGVITAVSVAGNYDAAYDAIGAAAAVQGSTTETVASVDAKVEALGTAADADVATVAIGGEGEDTDALPTVAQVKSYVATEVADLTGAMHFRDAVDELPTGEALEDYKAGDVILVGTKEYVFNGTAFKEFGDETMYVAKTTTIAGVDLQDNITATELKAALDIDDLEGLVGTESVSSQIDATAKDATYTPANETAGTAKVTIAQAIKANADAIAALDISGDIDDKIAELDADKTSAAVEEGKGLQVQVTEVDGKIDSVVVTGSFDNKYDEIGAAAAVQSALEYTVATEAEISAMFPTAE